jgi:hypothetical protein
MYPQYQKTISQLSIDILVLIEVNVIVLDEEKREQSWLCGM